MPHVPPGPVSIVDFKMPFGSMVLFLIKLALAAIPALLILGLLSAIGAGIITAIGLSMR